jgi:hypothetical protein
MQIDLYKEVSLLRFTASIKLHTRFFSTRLLPISTNAHTCIALSPHRLVLYYAVSC